MPRLSARAVAPLGVTATEVSFTLFDRTWAADFAPHEIKIRIPAEGT